MRERLLTSLSIAALALGLNAQAQAAPQAATLTINDPAATPEVLQVLDRNGAWVRLGDVDPAAHAFTPASPPGPFVVATVAADGYVNGDATIDLGSPNVLTASSRPCASADLGKVLIAAGAAAASGPLKTTVTGCAGQNYAMADAAQTAQAATEWAIGTDQSAAINALVAANPGALIAFPPGMMLIDATSINLGNIALAGAGVPGLGQPGTTKTYSGGTTLLIVSPTVGPLVVNGAVRLDGFRFLWPGQWGVTKTPVAYPPLFSDGTSGTHEFWASNNTVYNAYDIFKQANGATSSLGNWHWSNNQMYALDAYLDINKVGEDLYLIGNLFGANVFCSGSGGCGADSWGNQRNLLVWGSTYGDFIRSTGNGSSSGGCSNLSVYGLNVVGGTIHNLSRLIHLINGNMDESQFVNVDINGVSSILWADAGSMFRGTVMMAQMTASRTLEVTADGSGNPAVNYLGTCTAGVNRASISIIGKLSSNTGNYVYNVQSTNLGSMFVSGETMDYGLLAYTVASGGPYSITNGGTTVIAGSNGPGPFFNATAGTQNVIDLVTGQSIGTAAAWTAGSLTVTGSGAYTVATGDTLQVGGYFTDRPFALINAPNANITFSGLNIEPSAPWWADNGTWANHARGLQLAAGHFSIAGVQCSRVYYCIETSALAAGSSASITGSGSINSPSPLSLHITDYSKVAIGLGNAFDKPDPASVSKVPGFAGLSVYTVAALPTCGAAQAGELAYVSDAAAPAYNATLAGGGAVRTLAFCNGSNWTAH